MKFRVIRRNDRPGGRNQVRTAAFAGINEQTFPAQGDVAAISESFNISLARRIRNRPYYATRGVDFDNRFGVTRAPTPSIAYPVIVSYFDYAVQVSLVTVRFRHLERRNYRARAFRGAPADRRQNKNAAIAPVSA